MRDAAALSRGGPGVGVAEAAGGTGGAGVSRAPWAARGERSVRRVGVDACCLLGSRTGIANYVEALLLPLTRLQPDTTFFLYSNGEGHLPAGPNVVHRISRPRRRAPLWHNTQALGMLRADAVDIFWGTNGLIPLHGLGRTASIVTIHDLVHRFAPHTQHAAIRWKQRVFQPLCVRAADRVVAVSRSTAGDVAACYGRAPDAVIEPLANATFGPTDGTVTAATLAGLGLSSPYLLTVGTLEPRKNLLALVAAYLACVRGGAALPQLVLVGGEGWLDGPLQAALRDPALEGRVRWLGFVPNDVLVHLYAGCQAFFMPSIYEGYGMPLLEAQLCRAPVVHGQHRSMAEAAGGVGVATGTSPDALRGTLWALAQGRLPLVSRLPATIRNDAADSARRLWQLMSAAASERSRRRASQLA